MRKSPKYGCCVLILSLLWGGGALAQEEDFQYLPEVETVYLKPQVRAEPYTATIYTVIADDLLKIVNNILLYDSVDQYEALPYVVAFEEHRNIEHEGKIAYTRGIQKKNDYVEYTLLRPGKILKDPVTGDLLGLQAFVNGYVEVQKFGDPQTVLIKDSQTAVEINARLIPLVGIDLPAIVDVKYPSRPMTGYILSIENDLSVGGAYMPVVISLGSKDCLRVGHVLDLVEKRYEVTDPNQRNKIQVPVTKIGEVMVYKVGKKISLGVITYSDRHINPKDIVTVLGFDN